MHILNKQCIQYTVRTCMYCIFLTCSDHQAEEHTPDIMWCREPFMEELNEIEALNDINN